MTQTELQAELTVLKNLLRQALRERNAALARVAELESQIEPLPPRVRRRRRVLQLGR